MSTIKLLVYSAIFCLVTAAFWTCFSHAAGAIALAAGLLLLLAAGMSFIGGYNGEEDI